jgi:thiosulfate reductase cytochrome b subunit
MRLIRSRKFLFSSLLLILVISSAAVIARLVSARSNSKTGEQASQFHPTFALLDAGERNVLESGEPVSTMKTCGQCHDTEFIASHSFHADLGASDQFAPGEGIVPWDTSPGLYGKWDPLKYRYLTPAGDTTTDLDTTTWMQLFAERIAGGGPVESANVEFNCFLCHLTQPNNNARIETIRSGDPAWAATATLLGSGIVEPSGESFQWSPEAFTEEGELADPYVMIQDPSNENCAQCHGLVHTDPEQALTLTGCSLENLQTATTGQVISGQKVAMSGMNLADKTDQTYAWDIHAERGVQCTDCHFSLNNPAYYTESDENRPDTLIYDPRRLEIGEYLEKPDHNLARGQSAQYTIAPELKGTMRRCESCHSVDSHNDWLPYVERHMQEVACETCHIPKLNAPAIQTYDWTVLSTDALPAVECRGVEGSGDSLNDLVTGFQPVLLERTDIDGNSKLTPYNLITTYYWVYESPDGERPVLLDDLQAAWMENGAYPGEILDKFDTDQNGTLSESELRLDTSDKQAVIADRLVALGMQNPKIQAEIRPFSINHNVVSGDYATRDCQSCHTSDSRLAAPLQLSSYTLEGVTPEFIQGTNTQASSGVQTVDNAQFYEPITADHDLYVFGHNRVSWIDWLGALFFVGVILAVGAHATLRVINAMVQPRHKSETKKVYMYSAYERIWHWLQTSVIVILLITGLIIHRPDIFGFLSFRNMVTVHNVMAVLLVLNAALSLFYHLVSGEIRQYIPRPYGFFDQAIVQAKYYLQGIFKGAAHPFEKTPDRKMNPLQQVTYFGILNVLLPLQIITGALMWGVQRWPEIANLFGGLPVLAPFHSLVAWLFASFIIAHVYLTTTGIEPLTGIKAMVNGWEDVEEQPQDESFSTETQTPAVDDEQASTVAAD